MSHYEQRLAKDLESIRTRVRELSEQVSRALDRSVHALLTLDRAQASLTILEDLPINREVRSIDRSCHAFVARHLPSAGHLRYVSSVLRLMVAFERVGDYAVTICRETVQLSESLPTVVERDVEMLADQARKLFSQAARSFDEQSADLARGTKSMAAQQTSTSDKIFADLIREGEQGGRPLKDLFALLVAFNRLERVSDQAKNICEETIFAAEGETKAPKVYRILFVDERNDGLSAMAEAIARKAFPHSGSYASAGWRPAKSLSTGLDVFLGERGCDLSGKQPEQLSVVHGELAEQHVIVALEPGVRERLSELPFHTVLLEWAPPGAEESLEDAYKRLAHEIAELMVLMRGEGAS